MFQRSLQVCNSFRVHMDAPWCADYPNWDSVPMRRAKRSVSPLCSSGSSDDMIVWDDTFAAICPYRTYSPLTSQRWCSCRTDGQSSNLKQARELPGLSGRGQFTRRRGISGRPNRSLARLTWIQRCVSKPPFKQCYGLSR
jgi:hypothetical protein